MSSAPMHLVPDSSRHGSVEEIDDTPHGLVMRLARSDAAAITAVYRQHHLTVRAFAQRLVGDVEAAEDLVQEVFVALPNAISRFRGDASLRTFLISIAVNHAKNHVRAAARRRAALSRLALEPEPDNDCPEQDLERRQLGDRLVLALDELPLEQRVVVVLSEIEERTSGEIAKIVGAPEGTIRTRLFHAKRKLRELVGGTDG
ncbi:RNA polymerase sigma-70 factor, ECF subfamily [Labilithrix luteola]|uniref:RNA polymerase sigma-70 factor, ECF subfamily n=1 Tax=Labilithrix luteola TaxID=1391654 RepID=A0A0K1PSF9_9BACT|nr:RNA polymerase sigma factor [Labilithrix luteola]AKU96064.1 RNA polymerase sigma-70 factor, ECF subfamily [Labilithrix luteola]